MSTNDEKLEFFMAATGCSDFGQAVQALESTNWDLETATNIYFAAPDSFSVGNNIESTSSILTNTTLNNKRPFLVDNEHTSSSESMGRQAPKKSAEQSEGQPDEVQIIDDIINEIPRSNRITRSQTSKSSNSNISLNKKAVLPPISSSNPLSKSFQIKITNKHNRELFQKSYKLDTLVEVVRSDACQRFSIPIDLAIWNMPNDIIDTDKLVDVRKAIGNKDNIELEIENLAASMGESYSQSNIINVDDSDDEYRSIDSDYDKTRRENKDNPDDNMSISEDLKIISTSSSRSRAIPNFDHRLRFLVVESFCKIILIRPCHFGILK